MMNTYFRLMLLLSMFTISQFSHSNPIVDGDYKSSDGKYHHVFRASGDYWGHHTYDNSPGSSVEGVFEQGEGVCRNRLGEGGNIKFYVEEVQCCLKLKKISDKFVVSKIWVEGTGTGYALCNNHVLNRHQP